MFFEQVFKFKRDVMTYSPEEKKDAFEHLTNKINKYVFALIMLLVSEAIVVNMLVSQVNDKTYVDVHSVQSNMHIIKDIIHKNIHKTYQYHLGAKCAFSEVRFETPKKMKKDIETCIQHTKNLLIRHKNIQGMSLGNNVTNVRELLKRLNQANHSTGNLILNITNNNLSENFTFSYFYDPKKKTKDQYKEAMARKNTQVAGLTISILDSIFVLPLIQLAILLIIVSYLCQLRCFINKENYLQKHQLLFQNRIFKDKLSVGRLLVMTVVVASIVLVAMLLGLYTMMVAETNELLLLYMNVIAFFIITLSVFTFYHTDKLPNTIIIPSKEDDTTTTEESSPKKDGITTTVMSPSNKV